MTMTDFSEDFWFSFYDGGGTSAEVPSLYHVALNGRGYSIDLSPDAGYQRTTLPLLRPSADQGTEVGEASLNTEGPWRRSASDWSFGAGQRTFDREGSNRGRFWDSKGVDPWTQGELTLLHGTELSESSASTNLKLVSVGDYLYFVEGTVLRLLSGGTWSTVTSTGLLTITGITTDGAYIYVADGTGVYRGLIGAGAVTSWSTQDSDMVAYANGRMFVSDADVLYELDSAGAATALSGGNHANPNFIWDGAVGAPNGVYFFGHAGNQSEVYYVGVNSTTAALLPLVIATSLPSNERLYSLTFYVGLWFFTTALGVRLGAMNGTSIDYGELVETDHPVKCLTVDGFYAWYGLSSYDATSSGLGRLAPGTATGEALSSAYASDLMADVVGDVLAVVSHDGKRYFAVSGFGVYVETDTYVDSGWLETGWITYGYTENKMPMSVDFYTEPMVGSIALDLVTDDRDVAMGAIQNAGLMRDTLTTQRITSDRHNLRFTLNADAGEAPVLRAWVLKALPSGERIDEFIVPLVVHDNTKISNGEGSAKAYNPLVEYTYLKTLERTQEVCTYQEGASIYQVRVDRVQVRPVEWTINHHFFNGLLVVRLLTLGSN